MKKKILILVICAMQMFTTLFALEWKTIAEYKEPALMSVERVDGKDGLRFTIWGLKTNEASYFALINSGLTDEEVVKLLKSVRMETYEVGGYLSSSSAAAYMNSCFFSLIRKKYGDSFVSRVNYEFELDDIDEDKDGFTYYYYVLRMQ